MCQTGGFFCFKEKFCLLFAAAKKLFPIRGMAKVKEELTETWASFSD